MPVMRLRVPVVFLVVLLSALVAGCTRDIGGVAKASQAHLPTPIGNEGLDAVLLTAEQLSGIVGATLTPRVDQAQPVGGGPSGPCAGLYVVGAEAFVGNSYSAFRVLLMSDGLGDQRKHVVTQSVAVYSDAHTAESQFASATSAIGACDGRRVNDQAAWKFGVNGVTPDTVVWNKRQTNAADVWACQGQGRVRDNLIIEAMACQGDNAAAGNVDTILNRMSATVWELSAPKPSR
jgi:hypothetical protein